MKEIHERKVSRSDAIASIVAMEMEVVPVVAGSDLRLHPSDVEILHAEFLQDIGKNSFDALQNEILVRPQLRQHAGTAVIVVHDPALRGWGHHFARLKIRLVLQRKAHQLLELL